MKFLIRWYETPGKGMIMEGLESITEEISNNFLYGAFKGTGRPGAPSQGNGTDY